MTAWERVLNLYFILIHLSIAAVLVGLVLETWKAWIEDKKEKKKEIDDEHTD